MTRPARFLAMLTLVWSATASAQSPVIPVQGTLRTMAGDLVEGIRMIRFRLYNVPTAGTPFFEVTKDVAFDEGQFVAYLGDDEALPVNEFDGIPAVYLAIEIAAENVEMSPRIRMGSSPFALYSQICGEAAVALDLDEGAKTEFAQSAHSHTAGQVSGVASASHGHSASDVSGVAAVTHGHTASDVSGVASSVHGHTAADVAGVAVSGHGHSPVSINAADRTHEHAASEINGGVGDVNCSGCVDGADINPAAFSVATYSVANLTDGNPALKLPQRCIGPVDAIFCALTHVSRSSMIQPDSGVSRYCDVSQVSGGWRLCARGGPQGEVPKTVMGCFMTCLSLQ